jgi:hypothetical protein
LSTELVEGKHRGGGGGGGGELEERVSTVPIEVVLVEGKHRETRVRGESFNSTSH